MSNQLITLLWVLLSRSLQECSLMDIKNSSVTNSALQTAPLNPKQEQSVLPDNTLTSTNSRQKVQSSVLSEMFERVMKTYDRKFRPNYEGDALEVKLDLHVLSFSTLDEGAMQYGIDFYFAQFWNDLRLRADSVYQNPLMNLVGKDVDRLWLPDTVFVNSKSSKFHDVTVKNRFLSINFSDGDIIYHARITTIASCRMDLRDYPFDQQTCYLAIESYGHDAKDIIYNWYDSKKNNCTDISCQRIFVYDKEMSNFDVVEAIKSKNKTTYHAAAFSTATSQFTFKRRTQYFLLQVYLPCILIVMVTWTTFWITPTAVPARSAICVTTILTLITMLGIVNVNMPKVSYIKALDLYLFVSFIFVFLSLLEYIMVLNFSNRPKTKKAKTSGKNKHRVNSVLSVSKQNPAERKISLISNYSTTNQQNPRLRRQNYAHCIARDDTIIDIDIDEQHGNNQSRKHGKSKIGTVLRNEEEAKDSSTIDVVARLLFPIAFAFFNIGYWMSYLSEKTLISLM